MKYVLLGSLNAETMTRQENRTTTARKKLKELGIRLESVHYTQGPVDFVDVVDAPSAEAMLAFGFETLGLTEIVSFAVWNNDRSTAVMRRLGMRHCGEFDHPDIPGTHPHLKRHALYRLAREDWRARVMREK